MTYVRIHSQLEAPPMYWDVLRVTHLGCLSHQSRERRDKIGSSRCVHWTGWWRSVSWRKLEQGRLYINSEGDKKTERQLPLGGSIPISAAMCQISFLIPHRTDGSGGISLCTFKMPKTLLFGTNSYDRTKGFVFVLRTTHFRIGIVPTKLGKLGITAT